MKTETFEQQMEMINLLYEAGHLDTLLVLKDNFRYWNIVNEEDAKILHRLNECIESLLKEVIIH